MPIKDYLKYVMKYIFPQISTQIVVQESEHIELRIELV